MPSKVRQVLREALALPPRARADIAGTLLRSLDVPEEPGVEAAGLVEIERRLREVESGVAKLVPWDRVRRRLEATVNRGRPMKPTRAEGRRVILEPADEWSQGFRACLGSVAEDIPRPKKERM
jgi:hypothetical protein